MRKRASSSISNIVFTAKKRETNPQLMAPAMINLGLPDQIKHVNEIWQVGQIPWVAQLGRSVSPLKHTPEKEVAWNLQKKTYKYVPTFAFRIYSGAINRLVATGLG